MAPKAAVASASIVRSFASASQMNVRNIVKDIEGNIELQAMVQQTIAEYKSAKEAGEATGATVSSMVDVAIQKRKRTSRGIGDGDDEAPGEKKQRVSIDPEDTTLRRGQMCFAEWSKKMQNELILYADLSLDVQAVAAMSKHPESLKEALEAGFGLVCYGDKLDRVGTSHKPTLFHSMKQVYENMGSRLRGIQVDMSTGVWDDLSTIKLGEMKADGLPVKMVGSNGSDLAEGHLGFRHRPLPPSAALLGQDGPHRQRAGGVRGQQCVPAGCEACAWPPLERDLGGDGQDKR